MWSEKGAMCNIAIFFPEFCNGNGILADWEMGLLPPPPPPSPGPSIKVDLEEFSLMAC